MVRFLTSVAALALLAGCESLPNVGPSAQDVVTQASVADQQRYDIVEVDPYVVSVLAKRPPESFFQRFGDYRPPVEPRIGVGDFVAVTIWEAGAGGLFSAPLTTDRFTAGSKSATIPEQAVSRDGTISVPYAGSVKVAGLSTSEIQDRIVSALEGKAIQPQALVTVTKPISNTVSITGEVANGARIPLSLKGDRILDVIATAGGVRAPVHETFVQLSRGSATTKVPLSRVVADPRENIYLRPGDVLTLIRDPQTFLAYGATGRNAQVPFEDESITLAEALVKAGGLIDSHSDPAGVFVFRYEPEAIARQLRPNSQLGGTGKTRPVVYRVNFRDANAFFAAKSFRIFDGDIVYVSNAPFVEVQKVFQIFNTVTSPARTGLSIAAAVN